jgi:hypothetical protein
MLDFHHGVLARWLQIQGLKSPLPLLKFLPRFVGTSADLLERVEAFPVGPPGNVDGLQDATTDLPKVDNLTKRLHRVFMKAKRCPRFSIGQPVEARRTRHQCMNGMIPYGQDTPIRRGDFPAVVSEIRRSRPDAYLSRL